MILMLIATTIAASTPCTPTATRPVCAYARTPKQIGVRAITPRLATCATFRLTGSPEGRTPATTNLRATQPITEWTVNAATPGTYSMTFEFPQPTANGCSAIANLPGGGGASITMK